MKKCKCFFIALLCSVSLAIPVAAWDAPVVQQVQQRLNEEGYDCGTPDGIAGSKTTEAIYAFQEDQNLPIDGEISEELLVALGLDVEMENQEDTDMEESYDGQYDADSSDLYYTSGEDLVLLEDMGLQIILKGDQSEAIFYESGVELAVEVVNDSEQYVYISYGMNAPAQEEPSINITDYLYNEEYSDDPGISECSVFSGWIYGDTADNYTAIEDLTTIQLFFSIEYFSTLEYLGCLEYGPITVHFSEESASEEPTTTYLIGEAGDQDGKRVSLAQTNMFQQELEVCVPEEWQYSLIEKDGFAVGEFISSEKIREMKNFLAEDSGEAYVPNREGVFAAFIADETIGAALFELMKNTDINVVASSTTGVGVLELSEISFAIDGLEGTTAEFFAFLDERKTWEDGYILCVEDAVNRSKALILVNEADPAANAVYASLRLLVEGGFSTEITEPSEIPEIPENITAWCGGIPETFEEVKESVQNMDGFDIERLAGYFEDPAVSDMMKELEEAGRITNFGALGNDFSELEGSLLIDEGRRASELEWIPSEKALKLTETVDFEQERAISLMLGCCPCENLLSMWIVRDDGPVYISRAYTNGTEKESFRYAIEYYGDGLYGVIVDRRRNDKTWNWTGYYDTNGQLENVIYEEY